MPFKTLTWIGLLLLLLSSCDPKSIITYTVVNKSAQAIKVKYRFGYDTSHGASIEGITILPDSSKVINLNEVLGYIEQYNESHDSIYLYWLTIEQGNKVTHQNFKDKKYWKLESEGDRRGTYKLVVNSTIFNNQF
jgi:hypothetical protein